MLGVAGVRVGWTCRQHWFAGPDLQAVFKEKIGRDLLSPQTSAVRKEIAGVPLNREVDGKTVYSASVYTMPGSEGVTMGAMTVFLVVPANTTLSKSPMTAKLCDLRWWACRARILQTAL